jgi:hypothetical protein
MPAACRDLNPLLCSTFKCQLHLDRFSVVFENAVSNTVFMINE